MFDFLFKRCDYIIHTKQRKIEPMWKSSPISQFTQSELQQIQQLLREEIRMSHGCINLKYINKVDYLKYKTKIKKLAPLQAKVKHLTNL